ncbi:MAG: hypothetical protein LBJ02_07720 [Bifidobacteriaceae bacterium]|jgi:hypothetical protein|nr:hypothetical protein [Bifidobacteriaceae bacterium]
MLNFFERYVARGWNEFSPDQIERALIERCHARPAPVAILPEGQLDHEIDPAVERYRRPLTITNTAWLESVTPSCDFVDHDLSLFYHPEPPEEDAPLEEALRDGVAEEHSHARRLTVLLKESREREPKPSGYSIMGWIGDRHVGSLIEAMSGPPDCPQDPQEDRFRRYLGLLVRHGLI